jgi:exodeoxyribonuclease VII small subunit
MADDEKLEILMQKLEKISQELESGDIPFEQSLERYKEGLELLHRCRQFLKNAGDQIKEIHAQFLSSDLEN